MKTKLKTSDIVNFWIRLYMGPDKDFINLCVDRAYRDFNRTMHGLQKLQTKSKYAKVKILFYQLVDEITSKKFRSQREFDQWHHTNCVKIKSKFKEIYRFNITFGQSQKWINMTLKYLFALGDEKITGISKNYEYFHIPIDNIVLNALNKRGVQKLEIAWSRLDDYEIYNNYQKSVRSNIGSQIPMDFEFILFNNQKQLMYKTHITSASRLRRACKADT